MYTSEVASGHLEWGIVHTEKFFKEHAKRLEGKNGDFELLRVRSYADGVSLDGACRSRLNDCLFRC